MLLSNSPQNTDTTLSSPPLPDRDNGDEFSISFGYLFTYRRPEIIHLRFSGTGQSTSSTHFDHRLFLPFLVRVRTFKSQPSRFLPTTRKRPEVTDTISDEEDIFQPR